MSGRLGGTIAGWRLALRLGRREAARAKWRSLLVVAMIALPVAGVTAVAVTYQTNDLDTAESLDRRLGTEAAAKVEVYPDTRGPVRQGIDPDRGPEWLSETDVVPLDDAGIQAAVGGRPTLAVDDYALDVRTDGGVAMADVLRTDLTDPLAAGLVRLTDGRLPQGTDEVVVNAALADRGPGLGDQLRIVVAGAEETREIVGVAESTTLSTSPFVAGVDLPAPSYRNASTWLVGGDPVAWGDVEELNAKGVFVLSRSVVQDPPPAALAVDADLDPATEGPGAAQAAIVVLIVVMVILEVVLLAGPAFAVAARRQARDLALIAASGGTARQARRVVLGMAVVLGALAAVAGGALGIGLARLLQPLAQDQVSTWFGPFEVPWLLIIGVAAIGFAAAICAAVVPAWIASRQDVAGVLAGRRTESRPSRRSPVIGIVLLAAGVVSAALGAQAGVNGVPIAFGALLCVIGLLFVMPALVSLVARLSAGLPLMIRFATRDADRHRTRTVPAVGAVAVTVAGVVTLGIAFSSDREQSLESYQPSFAIGDAFVQSRTVESDAALALEPDAWPDVAARIEKELPGTIVTTAYSAGFGEGFLEVRTGRGGEVELETSGFYFGELIVSGADGTLPPAVTRSLHDLDIDAAEEMLRSSGALVFTTDRRLQVAETASLSVKQYSETEDKDVVRSTVTVPARYVDIGDSATPAFAVVSPEVVERLGAETRVAGLYVEEAWISAEAEKDLDEALAAERYATMIEVEHGFHEDDTVVIIWLLLVTLGAALMIGGALTATHLALNDARPDLATLSAVGAKKSTRRGVAASYALVIALLGAIPGAIIGLVPGIAISFPLTAEGWPERTGVASHYLDVPWGLIALVVVGLPVLIALIVAATTRSRLPLVARVD